MRCPTIPSPVGRFCLVVALPLGLAGAASLTAASVRAAEPPPPAAGDTIVFLGDSITRAGNGPGGYVRTVRETIAAALPGQRIEVIGAGVGGNKVPALEERLDRDVLARKPATVVIYIGINDVWHSRRGEGTPKDVFEKGLRSLVERIRAAGGRVILCTPSVIGEKPVGENPFDALLDEYSDITRGVAADLKTGLVDLRKAFVEHLATANPAGAEKGTLTSDGVHLNAAGNQLVAEQMLAALGVKPAPVAAAAAP